MDCIGFKIYAEPSVEPVSAADMRSYLSMTDTSQDTLLSDHSAAARIYLERITGRIFCSSTYDVQFKSFVDGALVLPVTPVQSITSVTHKLSNVSATLAANQYELKDYSLFPVIYPAWEVSWPDCDEGTLIVRVLAGKSAIPYDKMGMAIIKAIAADMYWHPEAQIELTISKNETIERLINSYRTR